MYIHIYIFISISLSLYIYIYIYIATPIHCTPLPLHPPVMSTQKRSSSAARRSRPRGSTSIKLLDFTYNYFVLRKYTIFYLHLTLNHIHVCMYVCIYIYIYIYIHITHYMTQLWFAYTRLPTHLKTMPTP